MTDHSLKELGENNLLAHFRALASASLGPGVIVGPGDDCAVLSADGDRLLLLACDMMVEGVHFRRDWAAPWQIGWKAMAGNLSDIAAMGGIPFAAVCSIAAPGDLSEEVISGIAEGLASAASRYRTSLVGGDLVGSPGPIVVDVAITGWVHRDRMLRRRGAAPGETILVTGRLGASGAGLAALQHGLKEADSPLLAEALRAHHEPQPRLAEAQAIASSGLATTMMDLSDGLSDDLPRLCAESGVGARLTASAIPIAPACAFVADSLSRLAQCSENGMAESRKAERSGGLQHDPPDDRNLRDSASLSAFGLALSGGEDYELLLTCPPRNVEQLRGAVAEAAGAALTAIGEITADEGISVVDSEGRERPLGHGFDHFSVPPG